MTSPLEGISHVADQLRSHFEKPPTPISQGNRLVVHSTPTGEPVVDPSHIDATPKTPEALATTGSPSKTETPTTPEAPKPALVAQASAILKNEVKKPDGKFAQHFQTEADIQQKAQEQFQTDIAKGILKINTPEYDAAFKKATGELTAKNDELITEAAKKNLEGKVDPASDKYAEALKGEVAKLKQANEKAAKAQSFIASMEKKVAPDGTVVEVTGYKKTPTGAEVPIMDQRPVINEIVGYLQQVGGTESEALVKQIEEARVMDFQDGTPPLNRKQYVDKFGGTDENARKVADQQFTERSILKTEPEATKDKTKSPEQAQAEGLAQIDDFLKGAMREMIHSDPERVKFINDALTQTGPIGLRARYDVLRMYENYWAKKKGNNPAERNKIAEERKSIKEAIGILESQGANNVNILQEFINGLSEQQRKEIPPELQAKIAAYKDKPIGWAELVSNFFEFNSMGHQSKALKIVGAETQRESTGRPLTNEMLHFLNGRNELGTLLKLTGGNWGVENDPSERERVSRQAFKQMYGRDPDPQELFQIQHALYSSGSGGPMELAILVCSMAGLGQRELEFGMDGGGSQQ